MNGELFNMSQAWDKKKVVRNPTHDLPNTGRVLH